MTYYRQLKCAQRNLKQSIANFERSMLHFKEANCVVDCPKDGGFLNDEAMGYMTDAKKALKAIDKELEDHLAEEPRAQAKAPPRD